MRPQPKTEAARSLVELNARLDRIEEELDNLEDLLEELWDRAIEPVRAPAE